MIDFASRIDDLHSFLRREYGIEDRQATEIILATQITCPRIPPVWLILETDWFNLSLDKSWFTFGGSLSPGPESLLQGLRIHRPCFYRPVIQKWLESPNCTRLFVEPEWHDRKTMSWKLPIFPVLLARCIRLRAKTPKTRASFAENIGAREGEVRWLAGRVLDIRERHSRDAGKLLPTIKEPASFLYYAELLQKASPLQSDWSMLTANLANIAVRRAWLFDREQIDSSDWQAVARVMADSIPIWVAKVIQELYDVSVRGSGKVRSQIALQTRIGMTESMLKRTMIDLMQDQVVGRIGRNGGYFLKHPDYWRLAAGKAMFE